MPEQPASTKSEQSEIAVLSLASVTLPQIRQDNFSTRHVPYGAGDAYLEKINDYASYSPTHKSILLLKQNLITGGGLMCDKANGGLAQAIKRLNPKERSQKTLSKVARDYAKYNGFALQVIWNRTGDGIAEIYWLDFSRIRAEAALDGEPKRYYYSRNWNRYTSGRFKPKALPVFNPKTVVQTIDGVPTIVEPRQVYYYYEQENDLDFYPVPTYNAAFKDIEFEMAYSMYKANQMENGMFMTGIIHYNFIPTDEEKAAVKKELVKKHAGYQNAGKFLITFTDKQSNQKSVEFEPMSFTPDAGLFSEWISEAKQNIMTAHQLSSPTLAGIAGAGGLGGNASEITQAFNTYMVTYAADRQADIVDVLGELLAHWPGVKDTGSLDIMSLPTSGEIPDFAFDYADADTAKKWISERYGLAFGPDSEPEGANEPDGQLPLPLGGGAEG